MNDILHLIFVLILAKNQTTFNEAVLTHGLNVRENHANARKIFDCGSFGK